MSLEERALQAIRNSGYQSYDEIPLASRNDLIVSRSARLKGFPRKTSYNGGSSEGIFRDPIFYPSDLHRSFGNKRIFFQLQKKRKSAPKCIQYNSENLKLYIHLSSEIRSTESSFKNFERMLFHPDSSGITYYLAQMCWFHHCLEQMDLGIEPLAIREDLVKFVEYNRDPEIIDSIKDSFLIKLRMDESAEVLDECLGWLQDNSKYVNYNIEFCFPWIVDNGDWRYCLERCEGNIPHISQKRAYKSTGQFYFDDKVAITEKTRLYKNSVTSLDGELYRRLSRMEFTNNVNSGFLTEGRDPIIKYTRVLTFVSPGNIRDTFVPDQSSLVILNEIELLAGKFCDQIFGIRIGKRWVYPPDCESYGMIDTKKFGLTFPHPVLHDAIAMMEKLLCIDLSFYHKCIDNQWVYVDGVAYNLKRGFGLGNLNKLATLAHYWMLQSAGIDSFVYSDDVLLFLKEENADLEIITSFYEEMGFIVNKKKCYISSYWEFLGESSNDVFDVHQNQQEFARMCKILFNRRAVIDQMMSIELPRYGSLPRTVKRSLFFITYSIAPLRDPIKMLLPQQSGGFRYVKDYGGWVEANSDYPVFKYEPLRSSKKIMEYEEEEHNDFYHWFFSRKPIGVKGFRKGSQEIREKVSYPYKHLNRVELFGRLIKEGYHPTFLLQFGGRLSVNQCMSLVSIKVRSDDPTLVPKFPEYRFERVYRGEESALWLLSRFTDTPRMLLGEYHRIYRRLMSSRIRLGGPSRMEADIPFGLSLRTEFEDPDQIVHKYLSYPKTAIVPFDEDSLTEGIYETGLKIGTYRIDEFEEMIFEREIDEKGEQEVHLSDLDIPSDDLVMEEEDFCEIDI